MCAVPKNGSAWCSQRHWNAIGPSMIWLMRDSLAVALGRERGQELRVAVVAGGRVEERAQEPLAASRACPVCRDPCRRRRRSRRRKCGSAPSPRARSPRRQVEPAGPRIDGALWTRPSSITLSGWSALAACFSTRAPSERSVVDSAKACENDASAASSRPWYARASLTRRSSRGISESPQASANHR